MARPEIAVSDLYVNCSYPMRPDALAASDTCQSHADTAVVMENEDLMWRCPSHRGQRRPNVTGEVKWTVDRA